jgi:hypothetical protein
MFYPATCPPRGSCVCAPRNENLANVDWTRSRCVVSRYHQRQRLQLYHRHIPISSLHHQTLPPADTIPRTNMVKETELYDRRSSPLLSFPEIQVELGWADKLGHDIQCSAWSRQRTILCMYHPIEVAEDQRRRLPRSCQSLNEGGVLPLRLKRAYRKMAIKVRPHVL